MIERANFVTTDLFEATTPGEHFINPRCFGEDFATWLRERLVSGAIETSEPIQEDFGWVLLLGRPPRRFTLALGIMDESIGKVPATWRIDVSFERGLNGLRSWIGRPPVAELDAVFERVRAVLSAEPRFHVSDEEPE
ncbi:MAG: hypothetical protein AMXMBFR36_30740 [Acidobacteriota bacterium]